MQSGWTGERLERLLDIGIALSAEKDYNRLLERIIDSMMELTACDAGTLYLLNDNKLYFRIMYNHTMHSYQGGNGEDPGLPPVEINRKSVCALALILDKTICIDDVRAQTEYDLTGPINYDKMTGYFTKSMLVVPMKNRNGEQIGVLQLINPLDENGEITNFPKDMVKAVESVASQAAITIQNVRYTQEIKNLFWSFVQVLSSAVDERTPYNLSHTRHMAQYGGHFIDFINAKEKEAGRAELFTTEHKDEILMSVWLHDIGKLVTPLEVMNKEARLSERQVETITSRLHIFALQNEIQLLKNEISSEEFAKTNAELEQVEDLIQRVNRVGFLQDEVLEEIEKVSTYTFKNEEQILPLLTTEELALLRIRKGTLSDEERLIMQNHVVITKKLLSNIQFSKEFSHVRKWASMHHELLNGKGYPEGVSGDEIPTEVRIITILDIFDALVADDRPYKPGMPIEKALSILSTMAEKEGSLDLELTNLFIESKCWEK